MNKKKKQKRIIGLLEKLCSILPVFFWLFLIFGFEEPLFAIVTICSAIIHEAGHIGYILHIKGLKPTVRGVLSGFRIRTGGSMSYDEEKNTYLAGPIANIILFVLFSFLSLFFGSICSVVAIVNLITALSNLLPIEGYDGYGAIVSMINKREMGYGALRIVSHISTALIFLFCIFSLYLLDRQGEGYWIFAVFFISMIKCINKVIG